MAERANSAPAAAERQTLELAGPPTLGRVVQQGVGGPDRWKTIRASAIGSVLGFVIAAIAGFVGLLATHAWGSSDGSGAAVLLFGPIFFGVVGFVLGFAIPVLWHAWKRGNHTIVLFIIAWTSLVCMILAFGTTYSIVLILLAIGAATSVAIKMFANRQKRANNADRKMGQA